MHGAQTTLFLEGNWQLERRTELTALTENGTISKLATISMKQCNCYLSYIFFQFHTVIHNRSSGGLFSHQILQLIGLNGTAISVSNTCLPSKTCSALTAPLHLICTTINTIVSFSATVHTVPVSLKSKALKNIFLEKHAAESIKTSALFPLHATFRDNHA